MLMWGGGSVAAARRAGRYGLGYLAQGDMPGSREATKRPAPNTVTRPVSRCYPTATHPARHVRRRGRRPCLGRTGPASVARRAGLCRMESGQRDVSGSDGGRQRDGTARRVRTHRILTPDEAAAAATRPARCSIWPRCAAVYRRTLHWKYLRTAADAGECQQGGS